MPLILAMGWPVGLVGNMGVDPSTTDSVLGVDPRTTVSGVDPKTTCVGNGRLDPRAAR